jgi:hypothetical protein
MKIQAHCTWLDDYMEKDDAWGCCFDLSECAPFWVDVEYLYWKIGGSPRTPPLVFTGIFDPEKTPVLKSPKTKIVLGNQANPEFGRSGIKFSAGACFGGIRMYGTELNYMFLERRNHSTSVRSNDFRESKVASDDLAENSYLAVPFLDASTGKESCAYIAQPDKFAGKAILQISNSMQGAEWNFTAMPDFPISGCFFRAQALIGFRYWNFKEKLLFTTHSPNTAKPDIFTTKDEFKTDNTFYGGQIGLNAKYIYGPFSCLLKAKIALGAMNKTLSVHGHLLTDNFDTYNPVADYTGGYFALFSNIGHDDKCKFAYIPEINLNISYQIGECFHLHAGYTFLYVSTISWAENQIDTELNPLQSPAITRKPAGLKGRDRPRASLKSNDFFVRGISAGFNYHF